VDPKTVGRNHSLVPIRKNKNAGHNRSTRYNFLYYLLALSLGSANCVG
jgi:hypothetical protein